MILKEYPRLGEKVFRETLANGLRIRVIQKKGFQRNYAMLGVHFGSMDREVFENNRSIAIPEGAAHFLEHEIFEMEDPEFLSRLSARGVEPNAFTGEENTCFYFDCIDSFSDNLKEFLRMIFQPYFMEEKVGKEREVIRQEVQMVEDDREWQASRMLLSSLYAGTPVDISVTGTSKSIDEIDAQVLALCYRYFYTPANMCLTVVGDVKPEDILEITAEMFSGEQPKAARNQPVHSYEKPAERCPVLPFKCMTGDVSMPIFSIGFSSVVSGQKEDRLFLSIVGDMACDILMGDSSDLYCSLYSRGIINGSFNSGFTVLPGAAYVDASGESDYVEEIRDAILEEAKRIKDCGIIDEQFFRTKRAMYGITLKDMDSFENLASAEVEGTFFGYDTFSYPEIYDRINKDDLIQFICSTFTKENCATVLIQPKENSNEHYDK